MTCLIQERQVTEFDIPNKILDTVTGNIEYQSWCNFEIARCKAKGIRAFARFDSDGRIAVFCKGRTKHGNS